MKRWPEHLRGRARAAVRTNLRTFARHLAGYYGQPVYLCGSALIDSNAKPRDWDLRIALPDMNFERRYGCTAKSWDEQGQSGLWGDSRHAWSADCVKQSHSGMDRTLLNCHVQVYPKTYGERFKRYPKLLLAKPKGKP